MRVYKVGWENGTVQALTDMSAEELRFCIRENQTFADVTGTVSDDAFDRQARILLAYLESA